MTTHRVKCGRGQKIYLHNRDPVRSLEAHCSFLCKSTSECWRNQGDAVQRTRQKLKLFARNKSKSSFLISLLYNSGEGSPYGGSSHPELGWFSLIGRFLLKLKQPVNHYVILLFLNQWYLCKECTRSYVLENIFWASGFLKILLLLCVFGNITVVRW